ncbi:MAG: hypothetical protein K8W52_18575 [Deltaproteobacteria bacterium]|nr:hypothetical protein [Deltaproteobacteria bacterium]
MDRIVAQVVVIAYGKATRGAPGATTRNRLELGRTLPDAVLDGEGDCVHHVTMSERRGFAPREQVTALVPRPTDGLVELVPPFTVGRAGDALEIGHENLAGATPDEQILLPLVVPRGQWMRLLRHRTMRTHDARWFEDEAINLGRFARRPHPSVFAGPPPRLVDLRVVSRQPRPR